ncbi:phosphate ABC transporter, periplasmic phosphate-binding protein [Thermodesulfatator indicus DSM 15286]|uniref:Phosphate-binding protein PstS n=1 Tax=Thermodesulfatator indicus (strain DSM 15286 / JCM 11887 / CIR29812) TaxID=667014 RepID=F8ADR8_THEID|nr:phosphate ABC transporter substrate-binding protein PstS [Thermodesulfatator indicus]AEH46026.1 phosphate ABC transporter, periplasmic phosphate-binding protein [Thermodesulfatator indicus DSM 15286]
MKRILLILIFLVCKKIGLIDGDFLFLAFGATFSYPLYSRWFDTYGKETNTRINYRYVNSGSNIREVLARVIDFGVTEAPLNDRERFKAPDLVLHIPIALGAVTLAYNLPKVNKLKLTPEVLVDIYLGKISKWNDPAIAELNKEITLPDMPIKVVCRFDSSGTSYIFSEYLSKISEEWEENIGKGKTIDWPVGEEVKGSEKVAQFIKENEGTIGYLGLTYALKENLPVALIRNQAGEFVAPSIKAIYAATKDAFIPDDARATIINSQMEDAYPLSTIVWFITYQEQRYHNRSYERAKELVKLLWWCITDGQKFNEELGYGAITKELRAKAESFVRNMTYDGHRILGEKGIKSLGIKKDFLILRGPGGYYESDAYKLPEKDKALVEGEMVSVDEALEKIAEKLLAAKYPVFFPGPTVIWKTEERAKKATAIIRKIVEEVGANIIPMPKYWKPPVENPLVEEEARRFWTDNIWFNRIDVCVFVGVPCPYADVGLKILREETDCYTIALCAHAGHKDAIITLRDVTPEVLEKLYQAVREIKAAKKAA